MKCSISCRLTAFCFMRCWKASFSFRSAVKYLCNINDTNTHTYTYTYGMYYKRYVRSIKCLKLLNKLLIKFKDIVLYTIKPL